MSISAYESRMNQISQQAIEDNLSYQEVNALRAAALKTLIESATVAHAAGTVNGTCQGPGNPLTNGNASNGAVTVPA